MFLILKRKPSEANNNKMLRFDKTPDDGYVAVIFKS